MESLDIHSQEPGNAGILSNLYKKPFYMDGIFFGSIEGFLQGCRVQDEDEQLKVFAKFGIDAKRAGLNYPIKNDFLYYKGAPMYRMGIMYKRLYQKAFLSCFAQNDEFQRALYETRNMKLTHIIGKDNPSETIFTNKEFLGTLKGLQEFYAETLKSKFGNNHEVLTELVENLALLRNTLNVSHNNRYIYGGWASA